MESWLSELKSPPGKASSVSIHTISPQKLSIRMRIYDAQCQSQTLLPKEFIDEKNSDFRQQILDVK